MSTSIAPPSSWEAILSVSTDMNYFSTALERSTAVEGLNGYESDGEFCERSVRE